MLVFLFGIAALTVDGSLNYLDRRALRAASDAAALSGAERVSEGEATAQNTAMSYAFLNLGLTLPADAAHTCTGDALNPGGLGAHICVVSFGGYTITVTTNYSPANPIANPYSASASVSVDITHAKPQSGFAAVIGTSSVTVGAHSAATSQSGTRTYPFAIATRFLTTYGSTDQTAFGAVLVALCSKGGTGGFAVQSGNNGGLYQNGGSHLVLGSSVDTSSGTTIYQTAQALLGADNATLAGQKCVGGVSSQDPLDASLGLKDRVNFNPADPNYNWGFGFNAGPTGCASSDPSVSPPATCQISSVGTNNWQDVPCWDASSAVNNVSTTTAYYDAFDDKIHPNPPLPTPSACMPPNTHEGSYPYSMFTGFPPFAAPDGIIKAVDPNASVPASIPVGAGALSAGGGITQVTFNASSPQNQYFTGYSGSNADLQFTPGWYAFDGNFKVDPDTFECMSTPVRPKYEGCVFVFRNGAQLDMKNKTALICSKSVANHLGCAFEMTDGAGSAKATINFSNGTAVSLDPVAYTPTNPTTRTCNGFPNQSCMPIVHSLDNQDCTGGVLLCAVTLKQPSTTFKIGGTIYCPNGIYSADANTAPTSGQVVCDSVILQGGNASLGSGVSYKGSLVAPIPGAPFLFE